MVVSVFLFLGFSRLVMVFFGRVLKVVLVGVKMVNGFLFDSVFMRLVAWMVVMRVVWLVEFIVFLMMVLLVNIVVLLIIGFFIE